MSHLKRTILLASFISISVITAMAQRPSTPELVSVVDDWIKVAPANAGFTVLMPANPTETVESVEGHPELKNHMVTLETELVGYVLTYMQHSADITDRETIKQMLDSGRDGGIAAAKARLKSEKEINLNGYLGRELTMELPGGEMVTARLYWAKRSFYQTIAVISPKANDSSEVARLRQEAVARFLDSFTFSGENAPK